MEYDKERKSDGELCSSLGIRCGEDCLGRLMFGKSVSGVHDRDLAGILFLTKQKSTTLEKS
jgi:hypothetical protein